MLTDLVVFPGESSTFRWRELYFSTYDLSYSVVIAVVWTWLAWRAYRYLRRKEESDGTRFLKSWRFGRVKRTSSHRLLFEVSIHFIKVFAGFRPIFRRCLLGVPVVGLCLGEKFNGKRQLWQCHALVTGPVAWMVKLRTRDY